MAIQISIIRVITKICKLNSLYIWTIYMNTQLQKDNCLSEIQTDKITGHHYMASLRQNSLIIG